MLEAVAAGILVLAAVLVMGMGVLALAVVFRVVAGALALAEVLEPAEPVEAGGLALEALLAAAPVRDLESESAEEWSVLVTARVQALAYTSESSLRPSEASMRVPRVVRRCAASCCATLPRRLLSFLPF